MVHISLKISDLNRTRTFYNALLNTEPEVDALNMLKYHAPDFGLRLTLMKSVEAVQPQGVHHLGLIHPTSDAVWADKDRLEAEGMVDKVEEKVACCYAIQDKFWVNDPDGYEWEVYSLIKAEVVKSELAQEPCC